MNDRTLARLVSQSSHSAAERTASLIRGKISEKSGGRYTVLIDGIHEVTVGSGWPLKLQAGTWVDLSYTSGTLEIHAPTGYKGA